MSDLYADSPRVDLTVDVADVVGPCEWWRQAIGHGGINSHPLPQKVIEGTKNLQPRLIRIFIQEFFDIYPARDTFNWTLLDPYMDALATTGASVMASITIKPKVLFPLVNQNVWHPESVAEWQQVVAELVKRYSVDRKVVTHWAVGNEVDIGENGGCPYLITSPSDFGAYYALTIKPILETFPEAKVGGPSVANGRHEVLAGLVDYCSKNRLPLDFVSWNRYEGNPAEHADLVNLNRQICERYSGAKPELVVTEWNKSPSAWGGENGASSVEEQAFDAERAASAAEILLAYMDSGIDWTFYYHLWDQTAYMADFGKIFRDPHLMIKHWNELPHRLGLFGVEGEIRPQYFVYWMLRRLGDFLVSTDAGGGPLLVKAGCDKTGVSVMIVNHRGRSERDAIASVCFKHLGPGPKMLTVHRIDNLRPWNPEQVEPARTEQRLIDIFENEFRTQIFSPLNSVALVRLEESGGPT